MSDLTQRFELTQEHRELILKYRYVLGRLETALHRWQQGQLIRRVGVSGAELQLLIGGLSYSCNHGKMGKDFDTVGDLCEHLEYADSENTGYPNCGRVGESNKM